MIGFQTSEWLESFLHYCRKELGAEVDEDTGRITHRRPDQLCPRLSHRDRLRTSGTQAATGEARQAGQRLLASTRHRIAMIGVDRLDYSKGLPERIDGIGRFFDNHPDRIRDLVYIQIAPPSREDVEFLSEHSRPAGTEDRADQRRTVRSRSGPHPLREPGPFAGGIMRVLSRGEDRAGHAAARWDEPGGEGVCRGAGSR